MRIPSGRNIVSRTSRGITLIELLVAMAISLIVLFAVTNVYLSTRANTRLQSGISRINENAEVSAETLARDIRVVSHMGCPALGDVARGFRRLSRDSIDDTGAPNSFAMTPTSAVRVFAADGTLPSLAVAGSPVIDITHAASAGAHLVAPTTARRVSPSSSVATSLFLRGDPGIKMPSVTSTNSYPAAIISDCATAEVFQVLAVSSNPWKVDPFNALRTTYSEDARVMPVTRTQYFVGNHVRPAGERTTRAIFKRTMRADGYNWDVAEPIIHDVDSLAITMEIDTDGTFATDSSVSSTSGYDTSKVVGMTINLILQTPSSVTGTNGTAVKRTSTATVTIRSRTV